MQLIKIGDRYINLDLVQQTSFCQVTTGGSVTLLAQLDIQGEVMFEFRGEEADALRYFLDANSNDVMDIHKTQEYDRVGA
jgi:hypothetical protein